MNTRKTLTNEEYQKDINRALRAANEAKTLEKIVKEPIMCIFKAIIPELEEQRCRQCYGTVDCYECGGYNERCKSYIASEYYLMK